MEDGIELRPITVADLPDVCALHQRSEAHDGVPRVLNLEELEEELDDETIVLATDTRLALVGGRPAGYAYTVYLPSEVKEERCYVLGEVDPACRRRGVGRALMAWGIERGSEQLRSSGRDLPRYLRADAYDYIEGAHALYAACGMRQVRWMEELLRPLDQLPPIAEPIPGLRIVPWPDDRDEDIRVEKNTSFLDHWGSTPNPPEMWERHVRGFGARPDLSFIGLDDDDRVVAHCFVTRYPDDDELIGRVDGWIDSLGTLREWRGKGVASALITHALHAMAAEGLTHASIGVDRDNPSGAAQLYRALGFELRQRSITSELVIER